MLSQENNDLLTKVGPGTPMGNFMREYWMPGMLSEELPHPDCAPVRFMLLGDRLVAFRDSNGKVGVMDHRCPHRGASLYYGRNEECGLRCVYHGWKFDADGNCVEMPNEPPESDFRFKVKAAAYPTRERGGVIWIYMGPRETPPPLPDIPANMMEDDPNQRSFMFMIEANWLQCLEGDIDTTHASFLHYGSLDADEQPAGTFSEYQLRNRWARFEVIDTEGGAAYGARRPGPEGQEYWRIAQWCFPFYGFPPPGVLGIKENGLCRIPLDDNHTMYLRMYIGNREGAGPDPSRPNTLPNTTDWFGRFRPDQDAANDFLLDREVQRKNEGPYGYTGIPVLQMQDAAVQTSMGPVIDRTRERLGSTDAMVIRMRRRLLAALRAHQEQGVVPPGVDDPEVYRVRSGGLYLPEGADWVEETKALRTAFEHVPGLDPTISGPI